MNSTGEEATIQYGDVHDCWSPSNPNSVVDKGHIMVRIILVIKSCVCFKCLILQATGKDEVCGTFMISLKGEEFKIEFHFSAGEKPTFNYKNLTSGPDTLVVLDGPNVVNLTAKVSFQITTNASKKI